MYGESSKHDNLESILQDESSKPRALPLIFLKEITDNFSDERVLGKGGTGMVYKGVLQSGEIIAVKRLAPSMVGAQSLFENEVYHLMRLKHPNIVRFMGYCYETQNLCIEYKGKYIFAERSEMLLCLEYHPKGSLDGYISDGSSELDWETRYKIIEGICNGLHYLHEQVDKSILHLDLKPANVLLDDNLAPKITDFGLSKLLDQHQTISSPNRFGTFGYMAPEYIHEGTITPESDIFSLGVIIMELIMGHKNYPCADGTSSEGFIELELKKWRNKLEKVQGYTKLEMDCQQIRRCIQIGLICVNPERSRRPTTAKIIKMLQGFESLDCSISNEAMSSADQISNGLMKHNAYFGVTEEGKRSSDSKLCTGNLEQAERRHPQLGEASVSVAMAGCSPPGKVSCVENQERSSPRASNHCFSPQKGKKTSNCSRDAQVGEASISLTVAIYSAIVRVAVPDEPAGTDLIMHPYVLSKRSAYLRAVFARHSSYYGTTVGSVEGDRMELREFIGREVPVGYDALLLVVAYVYSGRLVDLPKSECICVDEDGCAHLSCHPALSFKLQVLFAAFTFEVAELTTHFQRDLLSVLDQVEVDNLPMILSVANICKKSCMNLLERCFEMVVRSNLDMIILEKALPPDVIKQITDLRLNLGLVSPEDKGFPDKHIRRILRALDSDDVELVWMLLKGGKTNLDDAFALHYAAEYCDSKITTQLLGMELADVNHRNPRGYTALHIAARRRDPEIIVSLLNKGARHSDLTFDGRKALQISKRFTKHGDHIGVPEEGKLSTKGRLCIEMLEQAERRDPQLGEASVSLAIAGDHLHRRLLYLENRVALARFFFPVEARLVMDIAQLDGTLEFTLRSSANPPSEIQRVTLDVNETPFQMKEEHLARLRALSKTVELGKCFFPNCSIVLDKIMDEDELPSLGETSTDTSTGEEDEVSRPARQPSDGI